MNAPPTAHTSGLDAIQTAFRHAAEEAQRRGDRKPRPRRANGALTGVAAVVLSLLLGTALVGMATSTDGVQPPGIQTASALRR